MSNTTQNQAAAEEEVYYNFIKSQIRLYKGYL
jgi:hypothetical protein